MGETIAQKIIRSHLVSGEMKVGSDIGLRIDQTLTQDATGTMAYLEFEAMGVPRVKTERSVAYIDHNTLQTGFENADDHRFIQSVAKKHGIYYSRPGNGICHQVHLGAVWHSRQNPDRVGQPYPHRRRHRHAGYGRGRPGRGGRDGRRRLLHHHAENGAHQSDRQAAAPTSRPRTLFSRCCAAMTVKGGVGKIIEYGGEGVDTLSVPERATITNMGAELGATTSIFPSDEVTRAFLKAQGREEDWTPLSADADAVYDEVIDIDLQSTGSAGGHARTAPTTSSRSRRLGPIKVDQVCIGSCTNSSSVRHDAR